MRQFFARVVELREEKSVKYDRKFTTDSPSREFLEVTIILRLTHKHFLTFFPRAFNKSIFI